MPRIKRNIIVRKAGKVVRSTTVAPKKVKARRAIPQVWGMTKTEQRLATPMPSRNDLTKAQWVEHSEGTRWLKTYGVPQADCLPLGEQRDLISTIRYNEMFYSAQALRA